MPFHLTYYKQRKGKKVKNDTLPVQPQLWKLATRKALLRRSPACPKVLKLKTLQLIPHPGFRNHVCLFPCLQVFIFAYSCLPNVCYVVYVICRLCAMKKPAYFADDRLPVMKAKVVYAARRAVEAEYNTV